MKCFRTLLEYPPHSEHLRPKQWQNLADFVIEGIHQVAIRDETNGILTPRQNVSLDPGNGSHHSLRVSQASGGRGSRVDSENPTEELIWSLKVLTSIPNAPLMSKSSLIVDTLLTFLENSSRSQEASFEAINNILQRAITEDVSLAQSTLDRLIPLLRRSWSTKSGTLKEQVVITLGIIKEILSCEETPFGETNASAILSLYNTILHEYLRRNDREVLLLEDVTFLNETAPSSLNLYTVAPLLASTRAISNWTTLQFMATLALGFDTAETHSRSPSPPVETARKRPRLSTPIDELFQQALRGSNQEKLCAMQLLTFLLMSSVMVTERVLENAFKLITNLLDDDSAVVSWTHVMFSE